jgi:hypothetical protein
MTDSLFDRCHGDACANPAVVKLSSGQVGEFEPLCLSCLRTALDRGEPGEFEIALQRRSGDRLEGLVPCAEMLAPLPIAGLCIRVGLAPGKVPVAELPDDSISPTDAELEPCSVAACGSGAIVAVNPMLRTDEVVRACKRHLARIVTQTRNPEVQVGAPKWLPGVGEALASLSESIFAVQIFFELLSHEGVESSHAQDNSAAGEGDNTPGGRPFLIF